MSPNGARRVQSFILQITEACRTCDNPVTFPRCVQLPEEAPQCNRKAFDFLAAGFFAMAQSRKHPLPIHSPAGVRRSCRLEQLCFEFGHRTNEVPSTELLTHSTRSRCLTISHSHSRELFRQLKPTPRPVIVEAAHPRVKSLQFLFRFRSIPTHGICERPQGRVIPGSQQPYCSFRSPFPVSSLRRQNVRPCPGFVCKAPYPGC